MPLRLTAPLAVPGSQSTPLPGKTVTTAPLPDKTVTTAPLPDKTITTAPLLDKTVTAVPLLDKTVTAAPLPDTTAAAVPLLETTVTEAPLPETTVITAPLPEERTLTAHSPLGATPSSGIGDSDCPSSVGSTEKKAVVEPARADNFWITEEGASGPLPTETGSSAPLHADLISPMELPPAEVHVVGWRAQRSPWESIPGGLAVHRTPLLIIPIPRPGPMRAIQASLKSFSNGWFGNK